MNLASGFRIYQWETDRLGDNDNLFFNDAFNDGDNILIKAFVWNQQTVNSFFEPNAVQYQTIICIIFGTDGTTINQATEMVEDIGK